MEVQQIRYLIAVAETGNFTRAAELCNVSQPSLSAQIAKLEDELGGSLIERDRRGSRLSPRGEMFIPRAREIIRQIDGEPPIVLRLMELGLVPGTTIEFVRRAPLGDPASPIRSGSAPRLLKSQPQARLFTTDKPITIY